MKRPQKKRVPCDDIPDGVHFEQVYPPVGGFEVLRWKGGVLLPGAGDSTVARHLYRGTIWYGVMSGMTDDTEELILRALNAMHPKAAMPQKPCSAECPKCGSQDIYRRYRAKGRQFDYDSAYHEQGEDGDIAYGNYRMAVAARDCIEHHCRTCCHEWNTPTLAREEPK
jgi:hypothetical protein